MSTDEKTTRWSMLGTLAGACATRVAAKPYGLLGRSNRRTYGRLSNNIAEKLRDYLWAPKRYEFEARMLVDHGGPHFSDAYDKFRTLSRRDREWVLERLVPNTKAAAKAITSRATSQGWESILAEAIDAAGWFLGDGHMVDYVNDQGKRVLARTDLLVRRVFLDERPLHRLIVDLKYHEALDDERIEADLASTVKRYGEPYEDLFRRPVACCVLAYNETDEPVWSREAPVPD